MVPRGSFANRPPAPTCSQATIGFYILPIFFVKFVQKAAKISR